MTLFLTLFLSVAAMANATDTTFLARSQALAEQFTREVGAIYPESASDLGLVEFDGQASTFEEGLTARYRDLLLRWRDELNNQIPGERDLNFRTDLLILLRHIDSELQRLLGLRLNFRTSKASSRIYDAIFTLVNPQTPESRRQQAIHRFRSYVRGENGREPAVIQLLRNDERSIANRGNDLVWPLVAEVEDYLENSPVYVDAIKTMLESTGAVLGEDFELFRAQIAQYDEFVRTQVLPHARQTVPLPRAAYLRFLQMNGVDASPEELIRRSLEDYQRLLPEFLEIAHQLGASLELPREERTPFFVSAHLRSSGLNGRETLIGFARDINRQLERIIREHQLVTLPENPPNVRPGTEAENAVTPFMHVNTPPPLGGSRQLPEYIFPINPDGTPLDEDSHYRAAAVTLTAHELRPGHELQFSRLVTEGSRIRAAFGTTNSVVEGWAVYSEFLMMPHLDLEARYGALQSILFRAARAFLDPQVQSGEADEARVLDVFVRELGLAESFARGEFSRYAWRDPGQATAYYYGMRSLLDMKERAQARRGEAFRELTFNDFVIGSGPMPFSLCEELMIADEQTSVGNTYPN